MNRQDLEKKIRAVTTELLNEKDYICFADVFIKLGYLDQKDYEQWRFKKVPYLEKLIKVNLNKINFIMKTVQKNSKNGNLYPRFTEYKSWGKKGQKTTLRFSKSGEKNIEKLYSSHFVKTRNKTSKRVKDE